MIGIVRPPPAAVMMAVCGFVLRGADSGAVLR
jgi:hypothetical protein